jgi:hypothetical protein
MYVEKGLEKGCDAGREGERLWMTTRMGCCCKQAFRNAVFMPCLYIDSSDSSLVSAMRNFGAENVYKRFGRYLFNQFTCCSLRGLLVGNNWNFRMCRPNLKMLPLH